MKKLLLILLMLPCWCMAQPITDTTGKYKLGGSTLSANIYIPTSAFKAPVHDTIPKVTKGQIRPTEPQPAKPVEFTEMRTTDNIIDDSTFKRLLSEGKLGTKPIEEIWESILQSQNSLRKQDTLKLINNLKEELFKCQEKSRKDEIIIEGLFNTIQKKVTIQTKHEN